MTAMAYACADYMTILKYKNNIAIISIKNNRIDTKILCR